MERRESETHLEGELTTVEDGALERVRLVLELGARTLAGGEQVLEDGRQEAFAARGLDEEVCADRTSTVISIRSEREDAGELKGRNDDDAPPLGVRT